MAARAQTVRRGGQSKRTWSSIGWFVALLALVLIWLIPVIWIFNMSLKTDDQIMTRTPALLFFQPTIHNYFEIFDTYELHRFMLNSFIIAGATTVIAVFLALMAAYGFTRFHFRGKANLASWFLSLRMLPGIAVVLPFYVLLDNVGLLGTHLGLIIAYLTVAIPFALWFLLGFVREIPMELDEAAILDGCSHLQVFRHVILPVARPTIAVSAIFTFIFSWNEFLLALILGGDNAKTLPVKLSEFIVPTRLQWGDMSAAAIMVLIPLLIVVYYLQGYIVAGMTAGAVKGGRR